VVLVANTLRAAAPRYSRPIDCSKSLNGGYFVFIIQQRFIA
jgi:hypothetical protein